MPAPTQQLARPRPPRRYPPDRRMPGWPVLDPELVPDTEYVAVGVKVVSMITHCGAVEMGWDMCGRCVQHIRRCQCFGGPQPGRGLIQYYRQANGLVYEPEAPGGGPVIGLVRDSTGKPAPKVSDSATARMVATATDAEPTDDDQDGTQDTAEPERAAARPGLPVRRRRLPPPVPKNIGNDAPAPAVPRLVRRVPNRPRG